ncbi:MAG: CooT family nickel-binding protein [Anaerolineae bacterium]|jgi:predicted RNA-binding protein
MCQATVYLVHDEERTEIMRDVVLLEPLDHGLRLQAFFEEPVEISAQIDYVDFLKHEIILRPMEEGE